MKVVSVLVKTALVVLVIVILALGITAGASAWSNGGTHVWILQQSTTLAGSPAWLDLPAAEAVNDDPDTVYYDNIFHIYDSWGYLKLGAAPTMIQIRYDAAVCYLKAGRPDKASEQVGLLAHYWGDIWNPFHTNYELSTLAVQARYHIAYEDDVVGNEPVVLLEDKWALSTNPATAAKQAAAYSYSTPGLAPSSFSVIAAAYTSGAGYTELVDQRTEDVLSGAAYGLGDLIAGISAAAGM